MSGPAPVWIELWHEGPQGRPAAADTFRVLVGGYSAGAFRFAGDIWETRTYASVDALRARVGESGRHATAAGALGAVVRSGLGRAFGYSEASAVYWSAAARRRANQLPSTLVARGSL